MSSKKRNSKRTHGSGSLVERHGSVHIKFRPVPGKAPVWRKVCRIGDLSQTEVEKRARNIIAEYKPPSDDETPSFLDVGRMYIRKLELDGKKVSYTKNRWRNLAKYLAPAPFAQMPVDEIKVRHINQFKEKLQRDGKGSATINSVLWLISGTFRKAMEEEWRTDNPVASVEKPEYRPERAMTWLTMEQVEALIGAIPDDEFGKGERVMYPTQVETGIRRSEAIAVRWEDMDFKLAEGVYVNRARVEGVEDAPKSGKGRMVPLTKKCKERLLNWRKVTRYPGDSDYVFPHPNGGPLNESTVSHRFKRAAAKAGIVEVEMRAYRVRGKVVKRPFADICLHDLRDTFATHQMANPGNSPREVQGWLGHASLTTTSQRYAHLRPDPFAAKRMEDAFEDCQPTVNQNRQEDSAISEDSEIPQVQ